MRLQNAYGLISELIARLQGLRAKVYIDLKYASDESKTISELEAELRGILSKISSYLDSTTNKDERR
jgi:hypothetical protein